MLSGKGETIRPTRPGNPGTDRLSASPQLSGRKLVSEHWIAAIGLLTRCFILQNIPMFSELAILDANNIGRDPGGVPSIAREAPVNDHVIAFGHDQAALVAECVG